MLHQGAVHSMWQHCNSTASKLLSLPPLPSVTALSGSPAAAPSVRHTVEVLQQWRVWQHCAG
jgi:hypothetical protein